MNKTQAADGTTEFTGVDQRSLASVVKLAVDNAGGDRGDQIPAVGEQCREPPLSHEVGGCGDPGDYQRERDVGRHRQQRDAVALAGGDEVLWDLTDSCLPRAHGDHPGVREGGGEGIAVGGLAVPR